MFKRLYRQRRRIILFTALFALSMAIFALGNHELRYAVKHQWQGNALLHYGVLAAVAVTLPALLACATVLLFPSLRQALEAVGVALVVQALIERFVNRYAAWEYYDVAMWLCFFALYVVVIAALQQNWFRGIGLTKTYVGQAQRTLTATPSAVWAAMAPTEQNTRTYWTGSLIRAEVRPELGEDTYEVHFRFGQFGTLVQRHDRRVWDQPNRFEYDYGPVDEVASRTNAHGTLKVAIEPLACGGAQISMEHRIVDLGFGTWSLLWLDDIVRCELDAVQAHLQGRRDWSVSGWSARRMAAV